MDRRQFLGRVGLTLSGLGLFAATGCRSKQTAQVLKPGDPNMVGSHSAGSEIYRPLVEETVAALLARHSHVQPAGFSETSPQPLRICFIGVENKSMEEMGDFKEQLYQQIDTRIVQSQVFQPISRRFVDVGLRESRLRPDELMLPENMQRFAASMQQMGQPFDFMLYATVTSGTTHDNKDYQRDYLLTLELVNVRTGAYDKEFRELSKDYNVSVGAKVKGMFH